MEGGRRSRRAPCAAALLLMCMFLPAKLQPSLERKCNHGDYLTDEGICCNKCYAGFRLLEECHAEHQRTKCTPCDEGSYMEQINYSFNCNKCKTCKKSKHEVEESKCVPTHNTVCRCEEGYYRYFIDSITSECQRCKQCGADEKMVKSCTSDNNTVCECKENYYRVKHKCVPCVSCSSECKDLCLSPTSLNTSAPQDQKGFLLNIIAGVVAVVLVVSVAMVVLTHVFTKRCTEEKLLKSSSQPSDVSPDSFQVLIQSEDPLHDCSLKAAPPSRASEPEPSNLPDCVPLEIKIPELIYTVLDLVPVLQVKQLVRSLGVTDTVIEQAELDYRPCKEAHYQMLRAWAQKGTQAGGGGQDGMLHRPLLQEMLDKLRMMHLGGAAEELETKYSIQ